MNETLIVKMPRQERPLAPPSPREAYLDFAGVLSILRRRYLLFLLLAIPLCVLPVAISYYLTPIYSAQAILKIDPEQSAGFAAQENAAGAPDSSLVDTEVSVIGSRAVAKAVVQQLNLTSDPEFSKGPPSNDARLTEATIDTVLSHLGVGRSGLTYIVSVSFRSRSAAKAALIANAFADQYLRVSREERASAAQEQASALSQQLGGLGSEVRQADAQTASFRAQTGTVASGAVGTVNDQQISTIAVQLGQAESEAASTRARASSAAAQIKASGIESVSEVLASKLIQDLRDKRAEVLHDQATINANYGPKHPDSVRIQQQLAQIDQQISAEAKRIVSGLNSDASAADARAATLRAELGKLRAQQAAGARSAVTAESLQRDADAKRAVYNQLNQEAQRASQMARIGGAQAWIIGRASIPNLPSFPKKSLFAAFGFVLAVVGGSVAALIAEMIQQGFRTADTIEHELSIPALATLQEISRRQLAAAKVRRQPMSYVVHRPLSSFAEALRNVRSAISVEKGAKGSVIAITSAIPDEGKTVTATSLARVMAMSGERVLLIDCDLRKSSLRSLVKAQFSFGILEVLRADCEATDAVYPDAVAGLDIMPIKGPVFSAEDVFGGGVMEALLSDLRAKYDHIILDAPPTLQVADARTLAKLADGVILVVRWLKTPVLAVRTALSRLEHDGANIYGAILTRVDDKAGALSSADPAYYGSTIKGYYHN